jgi:hypothetical protein
MDLRGTARAGLRGGALIAAGGRQQHAHGILMTNRLNEFTRRSTALVGKTTISDLFDASIAASRICPAARCCCLSEVS